MKVFVVIAALAVVGASAQSDNATTTTTAAPTTTTRAPGLFANFPLFTFPPLSAFTLPPAFQPVFACVGKSDIRSGTCRTADACTSSGGYAESKCDLNSAQVCCLPVNKCGSTVNMNSTAIANSDYPLSTNASSECLIKIVPLLSLTVHYVRLELDTFELAPPNAQGVCNTDKFSISGAVDGAGLFPLCGSNSGQHIIVPIRNSQEGLTLRIVTSGTFARKWLIRVIQLEDNNGMLPPFPGCSQYFAGVLNGQVTSFNFRDGAGQGSIDGLNYAVCFRKEARYCKVQFDAPFFQLANVTDAPSPCAGQDHLGFAPSDISADGFGIGGSVSCGSEFNEGKPLVVDANPNIIKVVQKGAHGLGFALNFKYILC